MIACLRLVTVVLLSVLALSAQAAVPDGVRILRDVAYGPAKLQAMDVYLPAESKVGPKAAPVILMVHGGGWRIGGREQGRRGGGGGLQVGGVNYPMVNNCSTVEQADDIARALAAAQAAAPRWGGDPTRFILMGHSAGAHRVSLLYVDPRRATRLGAKPWLGTVSLDSGAWMCRRS